MKRIKLIYNLIKFDVCNNGITTELGLNKNEMLNRVYILLKDKNNKGLVNNKEVFIDGSKQFVYCNIFIKSSFRTINIQVIPNIHTLFPKDIDQNIIENRRYIINKELIKYGESLTDILLYSNVVDNFDLLSDVKDKIILSHWNQIPFKF